MTYGEIFVHPSAWLITFFFTAILTPGKNIDRMKALLIVHLHPFLSLSSRPHLFSSPSSSLPSPTLFSPTPTLFSPPLLLSLTTLSYSLLTTSATLFSPPSPTLFSPLLLLSSHHLSYSHTPPSPTLFSPPLLLFSHHPLLLSSHHFSYSLLTTSPTLFSPFPPPFLPPFLLLHFLPSHLLLLFFHHLFSVRMGYQARITRHINRPVYRYRTVRHYCYGYLCFLLCYWKATRYVLYAHAVRAVLCTVRDVHDACSSLT
jgi:hypothetical protein